MVPAAAQLETPLMVVVQLRSPAGPGSIAAWGPVGPGGGSTARKLCRVCCLQWHNLEVTLDLLPAEAQPLSHAGPGVVASQPRSHAGHAAGSSAATNPGQSLCLVRGEYCQLNLQIPWQNLYTQPVEAVLDGVYLLIVPTASIKYDAEKEEKQQLEAKQRELQRIEDAKQKIADQDKAQEKQDTFVEKLVTQVIKNLQLKISNIHIRYEDDH
ncbi:UNVERIFIED_CONTAM: hypothetical protein K2H54_047561 [Gekko kuhli]